MKNCIKIILLSVCSLHIIGCGKTEVDEGTPIADRTADVERETTPPTPEELEAMKNGSQPE
jgi:hypothetical protein